MIKSISSLIEKSLKVNSKLDKTLKFTDEEKTYLDKAFKRYEIKKNECVIKEGEYENYIYFIEIGLFRYWTSNYKGKETTFWFSFSKEFMNSYYSLVNTEPSKFNIQALTDSIIWKIKKEYICNTYTNHINSNKVARMVLEDALVRKIDRELSLLIKTPEQRYLDLINNEKALLYNVSLKHISSYLGITPQALSRIRKRIIS